MNRDKLKRRYGFFRCSKCKKQWESSHVYIDPQTEEVRYGQECKSCNIACKPYRVEKIKCSECGLTGTDCTCPKEGHHIDLNKPHRADLCLKCRAGIPCQSSYH